MEIVTVTKDNIGEEHICCAISNAKVFDQQVESKKSWLKDRFADGLVFKKGNVRGKCFIEYIPAEKAWAPISAPNYMYIDCLWVSGQFKGQGNSNLLLEECINDSKTKGKIGLVTLSSKKKVSFLSDPKYLKHKGFELADAAEPYFELMYLPFESGAEKPKFLPQAKSLRTEGKGLELFYTAQCPFTAKYVPLIEIVANEHKVPFRSILIDSVEKAQSNASPFTTYSLFNNGQFITHEIQSEAKFEKLLLALGYE